MENICIRLDWDLGSHEIQNKDNYSYEIVDPYLEGCKRYNVYGQFLSELRSIFNSCRQEQYILDGPRHLVNGDFAQTSNSPAAFNPKIIFIQRQLAPSPQRCNPMFEYGWRISEFTDSQCTNLRVSERWTRSGNSSIHIPQTDIWYTLPNSAGQRPPIKLKIIDGGTEHLYSINNKNSVQVIEYECGCPPLTLDCGDCCLDCNSIFNQISSIRALVKGLR